MVKISTNIFKKFCIYLLLTWKQLNLVVKSFSIKYKNSYVQVYKNYTFYRKSSCPVENKDERRKRKRFRQLVRNWDVFQRRGGFPHRDQDRSETSGECSGYFCRWIDRTQEHFRHFGRNSNMQYYDKQWYWLVVKNFKDISWFYLCTLKTFGHI